MKNLAVFENDKEGVATRVRALLDEFGLDFDKPNVVRQEK
jgi:hypothetical protein